MLLHTAIVPSCNAQNPYEITCSTDAKAIRKQILYSIEEADRKDVILLCHSYGGIPGGVVAYDMGKIKRAKDCKKDGVIGLIYVSGLVFAEGAVCGGGSGA